MSDQKFKLFCQEVRGVLEKGELEWEPYLLEQRRLANKYFGIDLDEKTHDLGSLKGNLELAISEAEKKEGIFPHIGLHKNYVTVRGGPLSNAARDDILRFHELKKNVYCRIREQFSEKTFTSKEIYEAIRNSVEKKTSDPARIIFLTAYLDDEFEKYIADAE